MRRATDRRGSWRTTPDSTRTATEDPPSTRTCMRSPPVGGVVPGSSLLRRAPVRTGDASRRDLAEIDTRFGTVHLTIGGGGHPEQAPARRRHGPHEGIVIAGVQPGSPLVQRRSIIETEPSPWSAFREAKAAFGFASFDVAPVEPGGTTSITISYWGAANGSPAYRPRDR